MKKMLLALAILFSAASVGAGEYAPPPDCPGDKLVVTKGGYYGAVNPDAFYSLSSALKGGRDEVANAIGRLKARGIIFPLPPGQPSCVVAEHFFNYSKRVVVPGLPVPVWVDTDGLAEVK